MKFYPCKKGGDRIFFSRAEVVLIWELEILAIVMGGVQKDSTLQNGRRKKFYPVLRGGTKVSDPPFSHFVA